MKAYIIESPRALYWHQGIVFVHPLGAAFVYANSPGKGIVRQSVEDFCAGQQFNVIREARGAADHLIARIGVAPRRKYDWGSWNCEHFVAWVEDGAPSSPQVQFYVGLAAVLGLLWARSRARG